MDKSKSLVTALTEEDRRLRSLLLRCPADKRELRGANGGLSFKETLGHLAFWDSFAVKFFRARLENGETECELPADFEKRSRRDLERCRSMTFADVFTLYDEATRALEEFLEECWNRLSIREREDFTVPLKHRRHHRLLLAKSLAAAGIIEPEEEREAEA